MYSKCKNGIEKKKNSKLTVNYLQSSFFDNDFDLQTYHIFWNFELDTLCNRCKLFLVADNSLVNHFKIKFSAPCPSYMKQSSKA